MSEKGVPDSWASVPIEDCLLAYPSGKKIRQGWSPQCESYPAQTLDDWAVLKTTAIQDGSFVEYENKHLPAHLEPKTHLEVVEGDVLITCAGPRSRCGVACLVRATRPKLLISGKMYQLRADSNIADGRWLESFLREPKTRQRIDELKSGISDSGLNLTHDRFKTLEVPLPPIAEQKRIADKLEAVLGRVDACRARLDRVPDLLKRFRQSVLAAATSGQLTEDWREKNDQVPEVNRLLARADILRKAEVDKANAAKSPTRFRYKPAALIDLGNQTKGIEELFDLPVSWAWASVGQLTWSVADGPHFSPKYVNEANGVPFISGRNITYSGIDFSDAKFVSSTDHAEFLKRAQPLVGDVLLTKGGTTGIATVVTTPVDFSIWVHVALLKPVTDLVLPQYLRDALSAPFAHAQSQALTHGVGNQDLGLTRMVHIALPLPPLPEQREIVRRVEALFAFADRIEARLTAARAQVERLTPATLAKAFRGELVPQDPNDEPSSALLERLRTQPAASGVPRHGRKVHAPPPTEAPEAAPQRATVAPAAPRSHEPRPAAVAARPKTPAVAPAPASPIPVTDLDKNDWMSLLREVLTAHGPCDRETVIQQAAYALDYQRAGRVVAAEIDNAIRAAVRRRVLLHEGHELRVNRASIAEMEAEDRDFMKDQFLAAISQDGRLWIDREEAARRYALWFGFRRTGSQIQDRVKSLINGLLRDQRLESEGPRIRRTS